MEDQKLMEFFKFDAADLYANRNGNFSEKQKKEFTAKQSGSISEKRWVSAIAFPASILMLLGAAYLIFKDVTSGTSTDVPYIFWLGLCGIPILLASVYIFRLSLVHQGYLLKKVEGPINIIKEDHYADGHSYTSYELHIGGETFATESAIGDVLMQGDAYAIYYSQGTLNPWRKILSVEPVSKGT